MLELRVMNAGEEEIHSHVDYEIFLVLVGEAIVTSGPDTMRLKKDGMWFVNSNVKHQCNVSEDAIVLSYQISYRDTYRLIATPSLQYDITPAADNTETLNSLRNLLKMIATLSVRGTTLDMIKRQSLYYEALLILVEQFSNWSAVRVDTAPLSKENRLQMISDYIMSNCHHQLSLQDLSERFYLSVPYLSKYIKRELGMGFVQYLNNIRLHNAVETLTRTARPVTQIAYDNGFTNLTSFNRLFKETFGCSPSEYRKNNAKTQPDSAKADAYTAGVLGRFLSEEQVSLVDDSGIKTIRIGVDIRRDAPVYKKNWNNLFTFGSAYKLLDSGIQEHVSMLSKTLGFSYIRIWGLFNEENYINQNSTSGFNFSKLNQIIDFIHDNGLIPFIDMGFHADEIYGGFDTTILYKEYDFHFIDLDQYDRIISQFLRNAIDRYGAEYVSQWNFEQWKDPRLLFEDSAVTFFTVFDVVYNAIKKIIPDAQVGGCALPIFGSVADFEKALKIWSKRSITPDFCTVTLYPYHYTSDRRIELSQDSDYFFRNIGRLKALMQTYGMGDKKLYIEGWNITRSSRNSINDSCYKAAFIVKNTIQCLAQADGVGYDGSTDLLDEHFDTSGILSGGLGLLTKDGIKKPAFYAYQFLNRLGGQLLSQGENFIATRHHDEIVVLLHNCIQPGVDYYLQHKDNVKPVEVSALFENRTVRLTITFTNVDGKAYLAKKYRINESSGSILDIWLKTGMPEMTDKEDIQYLKSLSIPQMGGAEIIPQMNRMDYKSELEPNEIQLIHFKLLS